MLERKPYAGLSRQLVIAFDIGTTYSGISFCILQPGQVPQPQGVLRYPKVGQTGDLKVPSVMYYDSEGNFKAAGYEVLQDETIETAMTEEWVKVEWWKLHLRPKHLSAAHIKDKDIPPLPKGKSIVAVLTDFIRFLFRCAETYIRESYPEHIWNSVKDGIQFVFTHPNGWEGAQQQKMRRAIELAGLVPSTRAGRDRVRFLTEGEAGLHFCVSDLFASGPVPDQQQHPHGQGVVVIDAGGGTLDLSMYAMKLNPTSFEEIAPAECRLQGSVFVMRRAKPLLRKKLRGSVYLQMIDDITNTFDQSTKLHISNAEQPVFIKVGSLRENDVDHDIKAGKLKLSGQEATGLFNDSIKAVTDAFEEQRSCVTIPITMAFLIGGFGANDWLWSQLQGYFKPKGIQLCRPSRVYKAVPDGAVSYYIDHLVQSRIARATYGTDFTPYVDVEDPEHLSRREDWFISNSGLLCVPNGFKAILRKGVKAHELQEFRHEFWFNKSSKSEFGISIVKIFCYRGPSTNPEWTDRDKASFSTLCNIRCDLREAAKTLVAKEKLSNQPGIYYCLAIDVIILFGQTEFSAQVAWKEDGIEKRSPAEMIYE